MTSEFTPDASLEYAGYHLCSSVAPLVEALRANGNPRAIEGALADIDEALEGLCAARTVAHSRLVALSSIGPLVAA